MRLPRVATALVALTAGAAAAAVVRRIGARRRVAAPVPPRVVVPAPVEVPQAVVRPFPRRAADAVVPARPAAPVRCGDTGGLTKAGAPCAARATAGGRCHHHRLAA
jgi:hypothetical protein